MLKMAEIKDLSTEELNEKVNALKKDLMLLRFQHKTGKLERHSAMKEVKHDIARVKTVITEKKKGEKKS